MDNDRVEARLESNDFACEQLHVAALAGRERISRLFELDLDVVAREGAPSREALAGAGVRVVLSRGGADVRTFHGMIARVAEDIETEGDTRRYRVRVVPRAHRLALVEMQEIYMDLSVPEILAGVLDRVGLSGSDVEMRLHDDYPKLEFVVQYKESDLAFASRLAEHHGLSFFFEHDADHDKIVFCDGRSFPEVPGLPTVPLRLRGERRGVYRLAVEASLIPLTYAILDYNYRRPQVDLTAMYDSPAGYAGGVAEYGTHVKTPEQAARFARIRAEEREAAREVYEGQSDACELTAGARVEIDGGGKRDSVPLLVVEVEHSLRQTIGTHGGKDESAYENTFRGVAAGLVYRSPRVTPRPRIAGVLTGVVEGAPGTSGKYAQIDRLGRYRVRFSFDTAGPGERKASRPVRMAQQSAGARYGTHFPLLPGTEVALAFVDGDPDRPLIVGAIPNAITPPPVTAGNSSKNQLKTSTGVLVEMK